MIWPDLVHASLLQNRSGALAFVELYYDYIGGRNLNIIKSQLGPLMYDNERSNGSTYYYFPMNESCSVVDMKVGILRPDWLHGASYLGQEVVDTFLCDVWQQGEAPDNDGTAFVTYYQQVGADVPVRWVFFDGASFEVLRWAINETASDEAMWSVPPYCFTESTGDPGAASTWRAGPLEALAMARFANRNNRGEKAPCKRV